MSGMVHRIESARRIYAATIASATARFVAAEREVRRLVRTTGDWRSSAVAHCQSETTAALASAYDATIELERCLRSQPPELEPCVTL